MPLPVNAWFFPQVYVLAIPVSGAIQDTSQVPSTVVVNWIFLVALATGFLSTIALQLCEWMTNPATASICGKLYLHVKGTQLGAIPMSAALPSAPAPHFHLLGVPSFS
jgi:hypothetical protein